jgi:hypothetical protein
MKLAAFASGFSAMAAIAILFPSDAHDVGTAAFLAMTSVALALMSTPRPNPSIRSNPDGE